MGRRAIRLVVAVLGLVVVVTATAADREPPAGGHPLARRKSSLADLLEQPDWVSPVPPSGGQTPPSGGQTPRPAPPPAGTSAPPLGASPPPAPRQPPARPDPPSAAVAAVARLQQLVRERNAIVDECTLFKTLDAALAAEAAVTRAIEGLNAAVRSRAGNKKLVDLEKQVVAKTAEVKPLYDRLKPRIQPWVGSYLALRDLLEPRRADDFDAAVTAALDREIDARPDFFEGRILAAKRRAYTDDARGAESQLDKVGDTIVKYRLFLCPMAHDCCHAWLLLGKPGEVSPYIEHLRKLELPFQTPERCRLVALQQAELGRYLVARDYFGRALRKAGPASDEGILGDAALFYLTAGNDEVRQPDKAVELLQRIDPASVRWEVVRARAAAAAQRGEWEQATAIMDDCVKAVPTAFRADAEAQRRAYAAKEPWHARAAAEIRTPE